jgi:hypothetical protein
MTSAFEIGMSLKHLFYPFGEREGGRKLNCVTLDFLENGDTDISPILSIIQEMKNVQTI